MAKSKQKSKNPNLNKDNWRQFLIFLSVLINIVVVVSAVIFFYYYRTGNLKLSDKLIRTGFNTCRKNRELVNPSAEKTIKTNNSNVTIYRVSDNVVNSECMGYQLELSKTTYYRANLTLPIKNQEKLSNPVDVMIFVGSDGKPINSYINTSEFNLPPIN